MIDRHKLKAQKRRMQFKRGYACKYCGGNDHYAMSCFKRPQKKITSESDKTKGRRLRVRKAWFNLNPPDSNGQWECYLQISPECPKSVDRHTISLEHVRSKVRSPKLIFVVENIKAACEPCNKLKRSWSMLDLAETYPNIFDLITTPAWQAYEKQLDEIEASM